MSSNINMSSKNAANVKLCQGKDVLERMNYLYQASHLMAIKSKNLIAASYYGNIMVGCAKKAVLRMNPDVKRTVCKSCQSPLIPGETARVRLVSKRKKMLRLTCLTCNSIKKFPTKKGYKLWSDQPEALIESFDYTPKLKGDIFSISKCEEMNESIERLETTNPFLELVDSKTPNNSSNSNEFSKQTEEKNCSSENKEDKL